MTYFDFIHVIHLVYSRRPEDAACEFCHDDKVSKFVCVISNIMSQWSLWLSRWHIWPIKHKIMIWSKCQKFASCTNFWYPSKNISGSRSTSTTMIMISSHQAWWWWYSGTSMCSKSLKYIQILTHIYQLQINCLCFSLETNHLSNAV